MRILIIEDSDADALRLRRSLQRSTDQPPGFSRAIDLAEGIRRCAEDRFDVVLLDLNLPDSTGIETVERFMAEPFDPRPAVVVLTAEDDEEMAAQALRRGVEDYLVKGEFAPRPVHRVLRHSIERKQMAAEIAEGKRLVGADPGAEPVARLAEKACASAKRIGEEAGLLAASAGDPALAERLKGIEVEAERVAGILAALLEDE